MAALAMIDGLMTIVRVQTIFPALAYKDANKTVFLLSICIEDICYFSVLWFFSIKYYETAGDLKLMLYGEQELRQTVNSSRGSVTSVENLSRKLQQRKTNYLRLRWIVFSLIVICSIIETLTIGIEGIS